MPDQTPEPFTAGPASSYVPVVAELTAERDRLTAELEHAQVDATAYRDLADALQATMIDPNRWDGDEAEIAIMLRYVKHLAGERDRLAAERTQLVLDLGNMRGIAQGNMRHVATLTGLLDAVQAIAADLRTPSWPGLTIDKEFVADRIDRVLHSGGTASVPGSSRRAQEPDPVEPPPGWAYTAAVWHLQQHIARIRARYVTLLPRDIGEHLLACSAKVDEEQSKLTPAGIAGRDPS